MNRTTCALAVGAGVAWVPFVAAPLSPDEGGFLLVASQWRPGPSLYGHYWVDRPPLLLTLFDLATHLGGAVGLRLIGIAAVVLSVVLASRLAVAGSYPRTVAAPAIAAVFLSTPLFGTTEVNGELLAVPLVLAGLLSLTRAWSRPGFRGAGWAAGAGAAGMAAALVKQNVMDVFVVAAVVVVLAVRAAGLRRALTLAAGIAAGATATLGAVLVMADARGTEPMRLWNAIVVFRAHASAVIQTSATSSTSDRLVGLLEAALVSSAPVVLVVLLMRLRGPVQVDRVPDLRAPALAVLAWELFSVAGGGSYWLHYLIGLVPGMVLLAVAAAQRGPRLRRTTAAAMVMAAVSCVAAVCVAASSISTHTDDAAVAAYLRDHSSRNDSVVVGFGHPNIVYDSGLRSPYEELWSLPVRVRDSSLTELTRLLKGRQAPTWVVVNGPSLATWGVDTAAAQRTLDADYRPAATVGQYVVWRRTATVHRHMRSRSGALASAPCLTSPVHGRACHGGWRHPPSLWRRSRAASSARPSWATRSSTSAVAGSRSHHRTRVPAFLGGHSATAHEPFVCHGAKVVVLVHNRTQPPSRHASARGIVSAKRAPTSLSRSSSVPPREWAISRAMGSPRPVPP